MGLCDKARQPSPWSRRGKHTAAGRGWLHAAFPPGSSGQKIKSRRISLKLCRRYLMDPCTTPVKFGANRPNNKKVFGTEYSPGQSRAGRGAGFAEAGPVAGLASLRGAFPGLQWTKTLKLSDSPQSLQAVPHGPMYHACQVWCRSAKEQKSYGTVYFPGQSRQPLAGHAEASTRQPAVASWLHAAFSGLQWTKI